jgi:hypothetical protein
MLKKITFAAVYLAPVAAFAGDGGAWSDNGALIVQAIGRLVGKLAGLF